MAKKLVVAASAVVVAAAIVAVVVRPWNRSPHHQHVDTTSVHASAIDQTDTSVSLMAMLNAPDGATPCETAFLAVEAEQSASKLRGSKSIFQWVAPKADFLAACRALAPAAQSCMMPRYRRDHREDCLRAEPASDVLKKMVVGVPVAEPSYGH